MDKTALKELVYDIERTKNWNTIHNLIMDYANEEIENNTPESIFENFDDEWWDDFINSIEHGEILDKEFFFIGL